MNDSENTITEERLEELFTAKHPNLAIVVGSRKAYNECNEHSLGASYEGHHYIDLETINGSDELRDVLKALGWSDAEMEETFVQDYDSEYLTLHGCDDINPFDLADLIFDNCPTSNSDYWFEKLGAILEAETSDIFDAVGYMKDYEYYSGQDPEEYAERYVDDMYNVDDYVKRYIDYSSMADDMDWITQTENGLLVHY